MNLWKPTSDVVVDEVKRAAGAASTLLNRRVQHDRKMTVWRNDIGGLVDESLRAMFCPENYTALRLFPHTSTNVLRRVVTETALAYQEPATRYLKGQESTTSRRTATGRLAELLSLSDADLIQQDLSGVGGGGAEGGGAGGSAEPPASPPVGEPSKQTPFESWLDAADLDGVMAEAQQLARFNDAVWIFPVVRLGPAGAMELRFVLYTPTAADVETDPGDATTAVAWKTWREELLASGVKQKVMYRWTAEKIEKLDERGKPLPNDAVTGPDGVNVLKRLPVTVLRLGWPLDSYYLDGQGGDLYDGTLEVAVLRTLQNARFRDSSFKQLALDADPTKVPPNQVMGNPAMPIYLGEDASVEVLDLQANLEQMSKVVRERVEELAVTHGISPASWTMSEKAQSGFSKKMDQAKVLKRNRKERKYLAAAEQDLYRLCARISQTTGLPTGQLDEKAELVVDFTEPVFEEAPGEQVKADAQEIGLGLTNIVELYLRRNPDLTEAEALQQLALNAAVNERFTPKKGAALLDLLAADGAAKPAAAGAPPNDGSTP